MSIVEDALALAYIAHKDQLDKCGQPFLGHPLRVAARIAATSTSAVIAAAMAHDTVEDTGGRITLIDVERVLGLYVAQLVDTLTRRSDETYIAYIKRVTLDADAVRIKVADIEDNMDPRRRHAGYNGMQRRYAQALSILREER